MGMTEQDFLGLKTYTCAACGQTCESTDDENWSNEKALEEKALLYPDAPLEECVLVCDPCFQLLLRMGHHGSA
jgi:hypothetical protein